MKKALIVVTNHSQLGNSGRLTGWYLPEVTHVYYPLVDAGFRVDFASPRGGLAEMDPKSKDLNDPLNLRFVEEGRLEELDRTLAPDDVNPLEYQVIYFAGGHGTMWDFADSEGLQKVTRGIYENGGIVGAVCHGPAALVNVKLSNGDYLVAGKEVNSFTEAEEQAVGMADVVPFPLQKTLEARGAKFIAGEKWENKVVVSDRLVTGQNPQSALSLGHRLVEVARTNF